MKYSVIVITYNTEWAKIRLTLASILEQTYKDYEIIISDDGSNDNKFSLIEDYLKKRKFTNFKLISHNENQGTVKNFISALENSNGEYVRGFGAGDFFYSKDSLKYIDEFLKKKNSDICIGLMQGYYMDEGRVKKSYYFHPSDIQAYRKKDNRNRLLADMIVYTDNPSGASLIIKKEVFYDYLRRISNYVKYQEDLFFSLAVLEGYKIELIDKFLISYESNTGLSTSNTNSPLNPLKIDVKNYFDFLFDYYLENKYVRRRNRLNGFYKIKNIYIRTLIRMIFNPGDVFFVFISFLEKKLKLHEPMVIETGFLDDDKFINEYMVED